MTTFQSFPVQASAQMSIHIKSLRKARGMTQTQLGQRIGVKQARVADIEKNPGAVGLDQLLQVLHALDARLLIADTRRYAMGPLPASFVTDSASADW